MKEGAYIGALIALIVYFMLPIYGNDGVPASVLPTGYAVSSTTSFSNYVGNLPLSMIIFISLVVLGIAVGIAAQLILKQVYSKNQQEFLNK